MAYILSADGGLLTDGLQGSVVCDEAIDAARRMAADRGEAVILYDDDGVWRVMPDGDTERLDYAAQQEAGLTSSEDDARTIVVSSGSIERMGGCAPRWAYAARGRWTDGGHHAWESAEEALAAIETWDAVYMDDEGRVLTREEALALLEG